MWNSKCLEGLGPSNKYIIEIYVELSIYFLELIGLIN